MMERASKHTGGCCEPAADAQVSPVPPSGCSGLASGGESCSPATGKGQATGALSFQGDDCCSAKEQEIAALGSQADVRRVLIIVLVINLVMFFAEFTAGVVARSTALMADSVDMLGDALVYMLSLYALKRSLRWRAGAALLKGGIIAAFGIWVAVEVVLKLLGDVVPTAQTMGVFGAIALAANLTCLALLYRFRNRDVNMSSTFECSRNDVIAHNRGDRGGRRGLRLAVGLAGHHRGRCHRGAVLPLRHPRPARSLATVPVRPADCGRDARLTGPRP